MSKIFILILFLKSGYGGGLTSAEFVGEQACNVALAQVKEMFHGPLRGAWGVCVEKGEPS